MAKLIMRLMLVAMAAAALPACSGGKMDPMQFGGDGSGDIKN